MATIFFQVCQPKTWEPSSSRHCIQSDSTFLRLLHNVSKIWLLFISFVVNAVVQATNISSLGEIFFSWLDSCFRGGGRGGLDKDHRGKMLFSWHPIKGTGYQFTVDVDLDYMAEVVLVRFCYSSILLFYIIFRSHYTICSSHLKNGELCSTTFRVEYLHKFFGILLDRTFFHSYFLVCPFVHSFICSFNH